MAATAAPTKIRTPIAPARNGRGVRSQADAAQSAKALHMLIEAEEDRSPIRRSGRDPTAIQQSGSVSAKVSSCGRMILRVAKSNPGNTRMDVGNHHAKCKMANCHAGKP